MNEKQTCTACGVGGHTAPGIIINGHQLRNALEFLAPGNSPEQLGEDLVIELHAKDDDFPIAGLYAYHSECPEEGAIFLDDTTQRPEQAEGAHVPDDVFEAEFMTWWEEDGQYCRSGGGDYERTFAFQAWRHLYPQLMAAHAALAQLSPATVASAVGSLPPFAEKVVSKLRRFYDCAEDFESGGVDIGRHWLDLLTRLGLLNRVQRSPALWEISQQGEDLLETPVAQAGQVPQAWLDVQAERRRQVEEEGWAPEHDDGHTCDEIAAYACFFIMPPAARDWDASSTGYGDTLGAAILPPDWQPKIGDRRRELVKGTALALAEIERLDRAAGPALGGRDE
ncbi:hypothetical protein M2D07_006365 [Pseudomonas sp. BGr12]|uniref:hypothetical protein n=1 Tax=Pseudomonas sp. BGr12 TaxID=2936269 RepID=UPI0025594D19|nr:hypothetical protein [Pseudomonas sp. BJa5]MDL2426641.1 hypothetical protein [Pseudomonas sp. BJa5]